MFYIFFCSVQQMYTFKNMERIQSYASIQLLIPLPDYLGLQAADRQARICSPHSEHGEMHRMPLQYQRLLFARKYKQKKIEKWKVSYIF